MAFNFSRSSQECETPDEDQEAWLSVSHCSRPLILQFLWPFQHAYRWVLSTRENWIMTHTPLPPTPFFSLQNHFSANPDAAKEPDEKNDLVPSRDVRGHILPAKLQMRQMFAIIAHYWSASISSSLPTRSKRQSCITFSWWVLRRVISWISSCWWILF